MELTQAERIVLFVAGLFFAWVSIFIMFAFLYQGLVSVIVSSVHGGSYFPIFLGYYPSLNEFYNLLAWAFCVIFSSIFLSLALFAEKAKETGSPPVVQNIILNDYVVIKGKEYDCFSLQVKETKPLTIDIKVDGSGDVNFSILSDSMFSRWKKGEEISDAYISKSKINSEVIEWIPPQIGEYCFLFDNTYSPTKKGCKVQIILRK